MRRSDHVDFPTFMEASRNAIRAQPEFVQRAGSRDGYLDFIRR